MFTGWKSKTTCLGNNFPHPNSLEPSGVTGCMLMGADILISNMKAAFNVGQKKLADRASARDQDRYEICPRSLTLEVQK